MRTTNCKARETRIQRHRIQIPDNCAKTALGGVTLTAVDLTRTGAGTVLEQLSEIQYLRL
jgi:hypothetical protein